MKYCNSCKKTFEVEGARYCPHCGQRSIRTFNLRDFLPAADIVIVYGSKETKNYPDIRGKLSLDPSFLELSVGDTNYSTVSASRNDTYQLFPYIGLSYGATIYENNKVMRSHSVIYNSLICYKKRCKENNPEAYCFGIENIHKQPNIVGCRQMPLELNQYSPLYTWGSWVDATKYIIDKNRIRNKTIKTIGEYRFCPFLNEELILKFVDVWPKEVNIAFDLRWDYCPKDDEPDEFDETSFEEKEHLPFMSLLTKKYPTICDPSLFDEILVKTYENKNYPEIAVSAISEMKIIIGRF